MDKQARIEALRKAIKEHEWEITCNKVKISELIKEAKQDEFRAIEKLAENSYYRYGHIEDLNYEIKDCLDEIEEESRQGIL